MLNADTKRAAKSVMALGFHYGWAEVQMLCNSGLPKEMDCGCGCKIYAIQRGCVIRYAVFHNSTYGCKVDREGSYAALSFPQTKVVA
jgi:hypothetical protein